MTNSELCQAILAAVTDEQQANVEAQAAQTALEASRAAVQRDADRLGTAKKALRDKAEKVRSLAAQVSLANEGDLLRLDHDVVVARLEGENQVKVMPHLGEL